MVVVHGSKSQQIGNNLKTSEHVMEALVQIITVPFQVFQSTGVFIRVLRVARKIQLCCLNSSACSSLCGNSRNELVYEISRKVEG